MAAKSRYHRHKRHAGNDTTSKKSKDKIVEGRLQNAQAQLATSRTINGTNCTSRWRALWAAALDDRWDRYSDATSQHEDVFYECEQLVNMCSTPLHLERFMWFALLANFDGLLHYLVLPLRILQRRHRDSTNDTSKTTRNYINRLREQQIVVLMLLAAAVLSLVDTSRVYHTIKRQSAMKLYMLFNVLEMSDTMLASLGQSITVVAFARTKTDLEPRPQGNRTRRRRRRLMLLGATLIYFVAHGYILLHQAVAMNVAVNSYSNSLLTLLLSIQFAEIKSAVFKKFDKVGLFQIAISDVVERYKLILFLIIIELRNLAASSRSSNLDSIYPMPTYGNFSWLHQMFSITSAVVAPVLVVIGSEIAVDWAKHCYIIKFNRIRPHIYDRFLMVVAQDYATNLSQYQHRLGLSLPTFVVLAFVMIRPSLAQLLDWSTLLNSVKSAFIVFLEITLLFASKILVSLILHIWCHRITTGKSELSRDHVPGHVSPGNAMISKRIEDFINVADEPERRAKDENQHESSKISDTEYLEPVARYKMVSKCIW